MGEKSIVKSRIFCFVNSEMEECGSEFLRELSSEVLFEILLRLPTKSVCRFKLVCKHWFSLISSNYFKSHYITYRTQDTPETFTLVFRLNTGCPNSRGYLIHLSPVIDAVSNNLVVSKFLKRIPLDRGLQQHFKPKLRRRNIPLPSENLKIRAEASCDDLLLCSDSLALYSVINLQTRKSVTLSRVPSHIRNNILGHVPGLLCYPHLKNISNEDGRCRFKVILVPYVTDAWNESLRLNVDIYCSETRRWSVVNVDWYPLKFATFRTPIIAHDGMLHWVNGRSLVSVDPFSDGDLQLKLCRDILLPTAPTTTAPTKYRWLLLGVSGGRIRLVAHYFVAYLKRELHVWDLQGRENKSWLLAHKIDLCKSSHCGKYLWNLAVHPYDTDLIFMMRGSVIYLFNLRTDQLEEYHKIKLWDNSTGGRVIASLDLKASVLLHQWFPSPGLHRRL